MDIRGITFSSPDEELISVLGLGLFFAVVLLFGVVLPDWS
jgi:hypothetical protein